MKKDFVFYTLFLSLVLSAIMFYDSCTSQERARMIGSTVTINLKPGEKLMECTWKDSNLWYLTEPMDSDYVPKTKVFKESDPWGLPEGKVIFVETR